MRCGGVERKLSRKQFLFHEKGAPCARVCSDGSQTTGSANGARRQCKFSRTADTPGEDDRPPSYVLRFSGDTAARRMPEQRLESALHSDARLADYKEYRGGTQIAARRTLVVGSISKA